MIILGPVTFALTVVGVLTGIFSIVRSAQSASARIREAECDEIERRREHSRREGVPA